MLPRRPKQIFLSRWSALFWACSVIFFAVTTIGFGDPAPPAQGNQTQAQDDAPVTDALGSPVSNADMAALQKYLDGK
jgi:hypothetical protein